MWTWELALAYTSCTQQGTGKPGRNPTLLSFGLVSDPDVVQLLVGLHQLLF